MSLITTNIDDEFLENFKLQLAKRHINIALLSYFVDIPQTTLYVAFNAKKIAITSFFQLKCFLQFLDGKGVEIFNDKALLSSLESLKNEFKVFLNLQSAKNC